MFALGLKCGQSPDGSGSRDRTSFTGWVPRLLGRRSARIAAEIC